MYKGYGTREDIVNRQIGGANAAAAAANQRAVAAEAAAAQAREYANAQIRELTAKYEEQLSRDRTYTALAEQIAAIGGRPAASIPVSQQYNEALAAISAPRVFGSSDLATRLNFQVSDQQILDDYNNTKLGRLNSVIERGNTQIAGIQERLTSAQTLLSQLPAGDPRRTASDVYVNQLKSDLASVQSAVTDATNQVKDFKPITVGSPEASKEITSFREFLQLPEERATQQLRQIDPESYQTAVDLGRRYREMATAELPATTTAQTEQLRGQLEQEAINQLALGSQLGAEEQRQYQQAARAAQTARGNVFGVAPAVEEAVTTGLAGEQRKLARYGAAAQFLTSGETSGAALQRDIAFRDALLQNRLGAAAGFIAGGPSLYNLGQARTGAQQAAFQNYVQANQPLVGQFGQAPSTAQPFYQAVDQGIPVGLTQTFANLYGSQAQYLASTYGDQTRAIASTYRSPGQTFGDIAGGLSNLIRI